jgi:hypothetical protein
VRPRARADSFDCCTAFAHLPARGTAKREIAFRQPDAPEQSKWFIETIPEV